MLLNLTELSSEPLHSQITRQLRARILTGEMPPGESLPSIRAMALELRVSVITVQTSYDHLGQEGLIFSKRTKGSFVSDLSLVQRKEMAKKRLMESFEPILSAAISEGLTHGDIQTVVAEIFRQEES